MYGISYISLIHHMVKNSTYQFLITSRKHFTPFAQKLQEKEEKIKKETKKEKEKGKKKISK